MRERILLGLLTLSVLGGAAVAAVTLPQEEPAATPTPLHVATPEAPRPASAPLLGLAPTSAAPAAPVLGAPPATPPPAPAATPPTGTAMDGAPLTLRGQLSHAWVQADQVDLPVALQLDVDAPKIEARADVPMDVILVMDRSGSMKGRKLLDAQRAALAFTQRLKPGDRVAVISYESRAHLDYPLSAPDPATLQQTIQRLQARGGTNIRGALQLADSTFAALPADAGRVRRVILLSDGRASEQEACADLAADLLKRGVSTTSMGLGADYDEKMLTRIADSGAGNYYFLASAADVAPAFDREIASLQSVIADNATLEIRLHPGVRLDTLHGFPFTRLDDQTLRVPLAAFPSGRNASLLLELRLDARHADTFPVADATLTYTRLSDRDARRHAIQLTAAPTHDAAQVHAWRNAEVLARLEKIRNAQTLEAAMRELETGNRERAQQLLEDRKRDLDAKRADLSSARLGLRGGDALDNLSKDADKLNTATLEVREAEPSAAESTRHLIKRNRASNRDAYMAY